MDKMRRQKVAEVEKFTQTVRELEEAVLAGGAAANAVRDYQRKVQEMNVRGTRLLFLELFLKPLVAIPDLQLIMNLVLSVPLQEERRTLDRELARAKINANRVAVVVANDWKDANDKVMPVKQWLEERRFFQARFSSNSLCLAF